MQRRTFILGAISAYPVVTFSQQQKFPSKPIKILVGSTPGALTDVATRLYADRVGKTFGEPIIVENVSGASSTMAVRQLLKSPADGYTLMTIANTVYTLPYLNEKYKYSPDKDFVTVAELARGPGMLVVNANSPYKTLKDLVSNAKKSPSSISYASGGKGTTSHLPMEMFQNEANIELLHISYKGVAPAVIDVIGGRVDAMLGTPTSMLSALKAGQLRPLAITSEERSEEFPDVPTFKELGYPKATYIIFIALVAPAGIPKKIKEELTLTFNNSKHDPIINSQIKKLGQMIDMRMNDINALNKFISDEEHRYAKLIKEENLKIE